MPDDPDDPIQSPKKDKLRQEQILSESFFMGEYYSTRKLYSDTLVSVMANSTPPWIMGQSTTAY